MIHRLTDVHNWVLLAALGFVVWIISLIPKPAIFNTVLFGLAIFLVVMWVLGVVSLPTF